jgi:hypothetical protein
MITAGAGTAKITTLAVVASIARRRSSAPTRVDHADPLLRRAHDVAATQLGHTLRH